MRYLSRLVISLSMMVVVSTVAGKSARAQDSEKNTEPGGSVPALAPDAAATDEAGAASSTDDAAGPKRKRRAKTAEAAPAESNEPTRFGGPAERNHRLQTGLSIMPGTGYRLIVRYKEDQSCGDPSGIAGKPICARRLPTFLDFQLAFGALARMDVIVDFRFGLEEDPAVAGSHQFAVAPGLRFWLDQEIAFKFFTTLQFVYDYTYFPPRAGVASSDFGVRNANGLMYDPIRNVGFYVQFGETLGFRRWFRIDLDVGLGVQIRFP
jgi:hypothetical protein